MAFHIIIIKYPNILRHSKAVRSCNVQRECFDIMASGFSSEEILQEPKVREDQLKQSDLQYLETF